MTAEQALEVTRRENPAEVIIIALDEDEDISIRCSEMTCARSNFYLDRAKALLLGLTLP